MVWVNSMDEEIPLFLRDVFFYGSPIIVYLPISLIRFFALGTTQPPNSLYFFIFFNKF